MKYEERCPNCGRFIEADADGFYDREWPYHDGAHVVCYCDEECCDKKRAKDQLVEKLTRNEKQYLSRRACGWCDAPLHRDDCCSIYGPRCTPEFLAERRRKCLAEYKPRKATTC